MHASSNVHSIYQKGGKMKWNWHLCHHLLEILKMSWKNRMIMHQIENESERERAQRKHKHKDTEREKNINNFCSICSISIRLLFYDCERLEFRFWKCSSLKKEKKSHKMHKIKWKLKYQNGTRERMKFSIGIVCVIRRACVCVYFIDNNVSYGELYLFALPPSKYARTNSHTNNVKPV